MVENPQMLWALGEEEGFELAKRKVNEREIIDCPLSQREHQPMLKSLSLLFSCGLRTSVKKFIGNNRNLRHRSH